MGLIDIKSKSFDELKEDFKDLPKYRVEQIFSWVQKGIETFEEMTNVPKELIMKLKGEYYIANARIWNKLKSSIDETVKYLFQLNDGELIEAVVMKYHHGYSMCISSQVGCKMGCKFCCTGKSGFLRNLTSSEMLAQITSAQKDLGIRISNIVLMGMGEPLDNYDNVIRFLRLVSSDRGLNIGIRHISLSTCGLVNKIDELSKENLGITLSVSLHAPNNTIRDEIMPVNKKWPIEKLIHSCKNYYKTTGRRISFEYAMIEGVNDSKKSAYELAKLLSGMQCHVNLIPLNKVSGANFRKTSRTNIESFMNILNRNGIVSTIRRTLGSDINASCGQLRRHIQEIEEVKVIEEVERIESR